jgi:asparagine synthase (glutamine-hydrolysing)
VVAEGAALPMAWKYAVRFEAALLAAIDPVLARHTSTYGHGFLDPPTPRHRLDEWLSRRKPGWLRRHSYALRRAAGGASDDDHGGPIDPALIAQVIDPAMPHMRAFFDIDRIARDRALWYRVACLEYFAQAVQSWADPHVATFKSSAPAMVLAR